jgi:hypothetical protein
MHGMSGSRPSFAAFSVSALTLLLVPSMASASTHSDKVHRTARVDSHGCMKPSVEIVAGSESAKMPLERCDGSAIPASVDKLSILARPVGTQRPKEIVAGKGAELSPGIRRLDARIAERLEAVADHFRKDGEPTRIVLVAPKSRSAGSYHASGRAIDFRIEGAENDAVAAFCKTVQDTGCGLYPNGGFVHMDVRDSGAGHVSWIDISKAGEAPKYVSAWPLPETTKSEAPRNETAKAETPRSEAREAEASKVEARQDEARDETKLPALPAAVQVAPMEAPTAPKAQNATEAAPVKKHHRHKRHTSHTI